MPTIYPFTIGIRRGDSPDEGCDAGPCRFAFTGCEGPTIYRYAEGFAACDECYRREVLGIERGTHE